MHVKTRRKLKRAFVQIEERFKPGTQRYAFGLVVRAQMPDN